MPKYSAQFLSALNSIQTSKYNVCIYILISFFLRQSSTYSWSLHSFWMFSLLQPFIHKGETHTSSNFNFQQTLMQSFIFHYVYHACFFHFFSRKEGTIQDREKRDPCWAWKEEKRARRGKCCLNTEIAKDSFVAEFRKLEFSLVSL